MLEDMERDAGEDARADRRYQLPEPGQICPLYDQRVPIYPVYPIFQTQEGFPMRTTFRIALILVSFLTCGWVLQDICKSRVKIENSVFWLLFSAFLLVISFFLQLVSWAAQITGVISASNLVFLVIVFILIVKLFRISKLESKLRSLVQAIAIREKDSESNPGKAQESVRK